MIHLEVIFVYGEKYKPKFIFFPNSVFSSFNTIYWKGSFFPYYCAIGIFRKTQAASGAAVFMTSVFICLFV